MRKPRNLSAVLSTALIPLGLAVGSFYFFSLAAGLGLFGGLLAGAAGLGLAAYAVIAGAAVVALACAPKECRIHVQATARRDEATGEWVAFVPARPACEGRACETAAAQKAIDDLSSAELGLAKASDRAGDAVKRTAQEVAEATAKQNAAREAAQRAAKALAEHTAITQAFGKDSAEAAASLARLKAAQDAAETAARTAERALEGAAKAVAETARNADDKATPALRRMKSQLETAGKSAEATASDLRALEARIESVGGAAKGMGAALSSFVGNLAANAVSSLAGRLADVGIHALSTAANFERMKTALATTLGGTQEAAAAFEQLQGFAAATPYSLEEVTNGFLKLKARGLDGSERALRAWGDTASAMGKTLDDMVEAVADATTGEFERLKEFGIRASSQGDKVALTFRGVTTTVAKEARAIEAELMRLGEVNFAGGMEQSSRTLGGLWSTMKDGFDPRSAAGGRGGAGARR